MSISNVETGASKTDYDVRAHKSNSRNGNSKTHNRHEKTEQPGESPRKEDSVTISDEAKELSERKELRFSIYDWGTGPLAFFQGGRPEKGSAEWQAQWEVKMEELTEEVWPPTAEFEKYGVVREAAENSILGLLDGKIENAKEVAAQLSAMIFTQDTVHWEFGDDKIWKQKYTNYTDLETRAADREAARDLAKRIAENYMGSPEEAQALIDKINKYIENSELLEKGYVDWGKGLVPPDPPSDYDRWIDANWDKYFGHLDITRVDSGSGRPTFRRGKSVSDEEFREAIRTAMQDYVKETMAYAKKVNTPYKFWPDGSDGPTWEERKDMNCDSKFSMYSEQNKSWYAEFVAKSNMVQNIINNAKSITDFSGNERWNIVMNLISGNKTTQEHL